MKPRWLSIVLIAILLLTIVCVLAQLALSPSSQAQEPTATGTTTPVPGDDYEPDDPGTGDPPWIADGEAQNRSFDPDGDVDRARLYVKAGHWYRVETTGLGPLVDTVLTVEVAGVVYEDDDSGSEPLASCILFWADSDGEALVGVTNRQAVYGPEQTYKLVAGEAAAPTPTPTATPPPTSTPRSPPSLPHGANGLQCPRRCAAFAPSPFFPPSKPRSFPPLTVFTLCESIMT